MKNAAESLFILTITGLLVVAGLTFGPRLLAIMSKSMLESANVVRAHGETVVVEKHFVHGATSAPSSPNLSGEVGEVRQRVELNSARIGKMEEVVGSGSPTQVVVVREEAPALPEYRTRETVSEKETASETQWGIGLNTDDVARGRVGVRVAIGGVSGTVTRDGEYTRVTTDPGSPSRYGNGGGFSSNRRRGSSNGLGGW